MGMIRVSDHAEQIIKEKANGRTITATVDALLEGGGVSTEYFDKKFDELKSLIEDTTVDRVAGSGGRARGEKVYIPWEATRELFYEFLDEKATEWRPGVYDEVQNLNDDLSCYVQDGYICVDDHYGKQHLLVQVSPRLKEFLNNKGIVI